MVGQEESHVSTEDQTLTRGTGAVPAGQGQIRSPAEATQHRSVGMGDLARLLEEKSDGGESEKKLASSKASSGAAPSLMDLLYQHAGPRAATLKGGEGLQPGACHI